MKSESAAPPSRPPTHHLFRPNFRSLAAGGVVVAGDAPAGEEEREPYAAARGSQYVRAFLPSLEDEHTAAAAAAAAAAVAAEAVDEGDCNRVTSPPPLPPPLRLAFPTVLEVLVRVPGWGLQLSPTRRRKSSSAGCRFSFRCLEPI